jgi:hypothetical protein
VKAPRPSRVPTAIPIDGSSAVTRPTSATRTAVTRKSTPIEKNTFQTDPLEPATSRTLRVATPSPSTSRTREYRSEEVRAGPVSAGWKRTGPRLDRTNAGPNPEIALASDGAS